jgi:hypothetical protein
MTKMKSMIAATVAAIAVAAPLVGAAEAGYNGFRAAKHNAHDRGDRVRVARSRYKRGDVATPSIDQHIKNQARRIRTGRRSGRLTRVEGIQLWGRLFSIRSARGVARLDGGITRSERRRLKRMLNVNSQRIRRLSRNGRRS